MRQPEQVVHITYIEGEVIVSGLSSGPYNTKDGFGVDLFCCWGGDRVLKLSGDAATLEKMLTDCQSSISWIEQALIQDHGLDPEWKKP